MNKFIFIFISGLLVSGCFQRFDRAQLPPERRLMGTIDKQQFVPRAFRKQIFDHTPGTNDSYDQGWQDGCQTATSAIGSGLYRMRGPKIDAYRLSKDQWYLRGFQDANTYCTLTLDWETH